MIGYATVGTRDLGRARAFYGPIFAEMEITECFADDQVVSWGHQGDDKAPRFFVCEPFDGQDASVGNGSMTAFLVDELERINRIYDLALENGGSDEGPPGFRLQYGEGFYAAYVRDPDGNKIAFVKYDANADQGVG